MRLEGSCQCGKVKFRVESETPYPFMFCYCSICRKTTGGAFGCNLKGLRDTLKVTGEEHLTFYHAVVRNPGARPYRSEGERWFCKLCGTHVYLLDDRWPDGVWPNAGAIDTKLPVPPSRVHLMTEFKPDWVPLHEPGPRFPEYPDMSIDEWHERMGLKDTVVTVNKGVKKKATPRRTPSKSKTTKKRARKS